MRKRRVQEAEPDNAHRWVISYADFITLLFAFFVVMYAISSVNDSKYQSLAEGMQHAFNQHDQRRPSNILKEHKQSKDMTLEQKTHFDALDSALTDMQESEFTISQHDGWIEMDIKASSLFDSSSADLKPQAFSKLLKLASILQKIPYPIILEGYTDNVPIQTPQFPSNWELSSARAAAVARTLVGFGVDRSQVTVMGYGEEFPVADNETEDGRAKNRRVNLIIAKDKAVPRLLNPDYDKLGSVNTAPPAARSKVPSVIIGE